MSDGMLQVALRAAPTGENDPSGERGDQRGGHQQEHRRHEQQRDDELDLRRRPVRTPPSETYSRM